MKKLVALAVFAAVIYVCTAYVPAATAYVAVRYEAQSLGHAAIAERTARGYDNIRAMVESLEADHEGLILDTSDVTLKADDEEADVVVRYIFDVTFPFTDHVERHDFRVAVHLEH